MLSFNVTESTHLESNESLLKRKLDDVDDVILIVDDCLNETQKAKRVELESIIQDNLTKGNYFHVGKIPWMDS